MFFSIEYVTGGDTGFALIDNGLGGMTDDVAYGMGGIETGFNGVLITMGLVWHVMFMSIVLVNIATAEGLDNGDPLLALAITLGFIFSATAFFRLQKQF